MRRYSEQDKKIIRLILKDNHQEVFGSQLAGTLFGTNGISLMLGDNDSCLLEAIDGDGEDIKKRKAQFISVLSLLRHLEQEGYIYCLYPADKDDLLFSQSEDVHIAKDGSSYRYTFNGGSIEMDNDEYLMKDNSGAIVMKGTALSEALSTDCRRFLGAIIYTTYQLKELVKNEYRQEEIVQYEKQLYYARKSLCVSWRAFAVSVIALILTVPISNIFGYSTMKTEQFEVVNSIRTELSRISTTIQTWERCGRKPSLCNHNQLHKVVSKHLPDAEKQKR